MKQFQAQLKKKANETSLKASEKRELRERLVAYMEYHPLPNQADKVEVQAKEIKTESFVAIHFNSFFVRNLAGAFMLFLIVGVPIIAERSVPGDVLYPVKVQFNEEVRSTLTRSSYDKVVWETERLERRISEARLLAKEGKLTPEAEAKVAEAIKAHGDAVQEELVTMRDDNADEAVIAEIAYNSALDVQSAILKSESDENATTTTGMEIAMVLDEGRSVEHVPGPGEVSVELLQARLELETTRAYELMQSITEIASEEELADVKRRLEDIERNMADVYGDEDGFVEGAYDILTEALSSTQKLIAFMTDIDVRESLEVEELVPVQLTSDEILSEIRNIQAEVKAKQDKVNTTLEEGTELEESVLTKIDESMADIDEMLALVASSTTAMNYEDALTVATNAKALVDDVVTMLNLEPVEDETEEVEETASTTQEMVEEPVEVVEEETGTTTEEIIDDPVSEEPIEEEEVVEVSEETAEVEIVE